MLGPVKEIRKYDFYFVEELLKAGYDVVLTVTGSSMFPFLKDKRDRVLIRKCQRDGVKKGDVVFFKRLNGGFALHRVVKVKSKNGVYLAGDCQCIMEGPISDVHGKVIGIYRKKGYKDLSCGTFPFSSLMWANSFYIKRPLLKLLFVKKCLFINVRNFMKK